MKIKWRRYQEVGAISFFVVLLLLLPTPSLAHWADVAVAEIAVGETQTQVTLTLPTGLVAMADDNKDGQLSTAEVRTHKTQLETFLGDRLRLSDTNNQPGTLTVAPLNTTILPSIQTTAHSTLQLTYHWSAPVQGLKIDYDLFLPEAPAARCLATIFYAGRTQNYIFSPENRHLSLIQNSAIQPDSAFLPAIAGSFVWGAMHAMSPGHGKTIVGAYLIGSRATVQHAVFLGLTTTITHTIGIFALGLVTLFASRYILPENLYPWLSFLSGLMVVAIGLNLFLSRWQNLRHKVRSHTHHHKHHHHVNWRSLLALGISGGLVPCPAALVLLLSAIALGHIGSGLLLVLAFSLGLAGVLTTLGLLLIRAKGLFEQLPTQIRFTKILPTISALLITLIGLSITTQALMQVKQIKL